MRKLLLSLAALFFMAGLVVAAEVTLVKYDKDKKEVTVKDDKDKEHTYKITDIIIDGVSMAASGRSGLEGVAERNGWQPQTILAV